jgi:hypothetical protein
VLLPACELSRNWLARAYAEEQLEGCRFPPEIFGGVWLYLRFTLSLLGVEDLLAER